MLWVKIGLLVIIFIFLLVAQATEMTNLFCKYYTGAYLLDTWIFLCVWSHHIYCMCPALCTQDHVFYFLVAFLYHCTCWLLASTWRFFLFLLDLLCGISVCWFHSRLTWTACGSLVTCFMCFAVACKLSIFLASCLTVLAGNLFNSTWPSLKVLGTNDSSFKENQKMSLCKIRVISCG